MKEEQQTEKRVVVSFVTTGRSNSEVVLAQEQSCYQWLYKAADITTVSTAEHVSDSVDFWGHKQVKGPAFPPSLFLNDDELKKRIVNCTDKGEIQTLFNDNAERVKKDPGLRKLFVEGRSFPEGIER